MNDCQTVMNNVSTTYTTVFHFLITSISSNSQLLNLMNTWKLHNMEYHFYSCGNHLKKIHIINVLEPRNKTISRRLILSSSSSSALLNYDQNSNVDRDLQYLNSLLKSIFYHQNGRFRCDLKACCLSNFCDRFMNDCQTVMNNVSTTYTTVFHFLITSISSNSQLLNLMNTWKLHNMEYHFYNCSNYLANLQWISSKHPAGAKPFLKLMLTEILPTNINKVIVLDNDILLNIDIIELWNHFENFNQIQSIGIGLEQNPHFQDVMPKLESNWEGYGYNNGVLLFDLSKIRLTLWNELWIVITRNALDTQGYLTTGEQSMNYMANSCQYTVNILNYMNHASNRFNSRTNQFDVDLSIM
uniref:Glycosyltransferase-like protein LARGE2 n=1 Tax=Schistosoma haematobium TaxID=6185 RepID=A0A095C6V6_SCHHA